MEGLSKHEQYKKPEGMYSKQLPPAESDYQVLEYTEEGTHERGEITPGIAMILGREYDTEQQLRRTYLVNKLGDIFESVEYKAYPYEDESRAITRVVYKDSAGNMTGVEALITYKGEDKGSSRFWEWKPDRGTVWDHTILEQEQD